MEQLKGRVFLFGAFTLAGTSVIAARFLNGHLGTFTITFVSLFFSVLTLLPLCKKAFLMDIKKMTANDWMLTILQAVFGIFLFRMFLLFGVSHTSSAEAGILTGATPAITAILACILLKENINLNAITGIISTILGIMVLQGIFNAGNSFQSSHFLGNLLVLCASVCESTFNILSRLNSLRLQKINPSLKISELSKSSLEQSKKSAVRTLNPLVQTTLVSMIASLFCLIPALYERPISTLVNLEMKQWLSLLWYGVFITAAAFIFWYSGIKRCSAFTASAFSGMMPLTSLVLSVLILRERASLYQWLGAFFIILGMILVGRSKIKSKQTLNNPAVS